MFRPDALWSMLNNDPEGGEKLEQLVQMLDEVERESTTVSRRSFMASTAAAVSQVNKLPGFLGRLLTPKPEYETPDFGIGDRLPLVGFIKKTPTVEEEQLCARLAKAIIEKQYIEFLYAQQHNITPNQARQDVFFPLIEIFLSGRELRTTEEIKAGIKAQGLDGEPMVKAWTMAMHESWEVDRIVRGTRNQGAIYLTPQDHIRPILTKIDPLFFGGNRALLPRDWKTSEYWAKHPEEYWRKHGRQSPQQEPAEEQQKPTEQQQQEQDTSEHPTKEETSNTTQQDPRPEPAAEPEKPSTYTNPSKPINSETQDIFNTMKHAHDTGGPKHQTWREKALRTLFGSPPRDR